LKESGAWPLASLRQSFLNGSLTRLIDPDATLRTKIPEFVMKGQLGLGSGEKPGGGYHRIWFEELISVDEVTFEPGVFLLTKEKVAAFKQGEKPVPGGEGVSEPGPESTPGKTGESTPEPSAQPIPGGDMTTIHLTGTVPPELWNRLGTKVLPKLRSGEDLHVGVDFRVTVKAEHSSSLKTDLRQIITDLGLNAEIIIE
jgi:hypothetical protein